MIFCHFLVFVLVSLLFFIFYYLFGTSCGTMTPEVIFLINSKRIGHQLKELRISRGWKQKELADKVGLSRPAMSNIESGKRSLTLNTLKRFCEVFNVDISYFDIETGNFDEAVDLMSRVEAIFNSDDLSDNKKDELYRRIMQIYLDSKK